MILANLNEVQASHLTGRMQTGEPQIHITTERANAHNLVCLLFLFGDMFASKRNILALLVRYIVDPRQCD